MESNLSYLSSVGDDEVSYIQPHYKESYRLAIYALLRGGRAAYEEFVKAERISHFLSEEEISFILKKAVPPEQEGQEGQEGQEEPIPAGTSLPTHDPTQSDEPIPVLELGWPEITAGGPSTSISLLFHPPRDKTPTIKEVVRKQIQESREVIGIVMDVFTDVDIFKELIRATLRGVAVYILIDDSQAQSFFHMVHSLDINLQKIKNMRVRVVEGKKYLCQSGFTFVGGVEQRFIVVDCRTVMFGTYRYTWSFEKINRSMVMVITGELVANFDEEFRRIFANSIYPSGLYIGQPCQTYSRNSLEKIPHAGQASLYQSLLKGNTASFSRGYSLQEMMNQSYLSETGSLVKGHSYSEEMQNVHVTNRMKMGTKNLGVPLGPMQTDGRDGLLKNKSSQQFRQHQMRYESDQNLIPYSSESSLHRWKMDAYLKETGRHPESYRDVHSPMISPHSSLTRLNEFQSQRIQSRSMDIRTRLEETGRQRLSLQEHANIKQSLESLRSFYSVGEKPRSPMRVPHSRQMLDTENRHSEEESMREADQKKTIISDGKLSVSHGDYKTERTDRRTKQLPNRPNIALFRTQSDADVDLKQTEPMPNHTNAHSNLGMHHSRMMESLAEVPEEKEASNPQSHSLHSHATENLKDSRGWKHGPRELLQKSNLPAESQHHEAKPKPKVTNSLTDLTQQKATDLQKTSTGTKTDLEFMVSTKQDKSLHKRDQMKSLNSPGPIQALQAGHSQTSALEYKKNHLQATSESQNHLSTEEHKSHFSRHSLQRSSKRKTTPSSGHDQDSSGTLDSRGATGSQVKRERPLSRLSRENLRSDKSVKSASLLGKGKSSSVHRQSDGSQTSLTHGADNKLGRFMQRVGNLIHKNK